MSSPPEEAVRVTFQNHSCTTVCSLYISPGNCDNWGSDWLEDANVPSGGERTLAVPPGRYDILVEDCTQAEYQGLRFDLGEDRTIAFTVAELESVPSCSTSLAVHNATEQSLCYLWISAPYSESFGLNWLADGDVPPGEVHTVTMPSGVYDLKVEDCSFGLLGFQLNTGLRGNHVWVLE